MWQKIQQESCFKEQGKAPLKRIVPTSEGGTDPKTLCSHCETVNEKDHSSGCSGRYDETSRSSRDVERGPKVILALPIIGLIRIYKALISPWLPPCCRFTPSCAEYSETALRRHGLIYGSWLMFYRLIRCQPFCKGGYDPVPEKKSVVKNP